MRAPPPIYAFQPERDSVPVSDQEHMERHAGRLWNDFYDNHEAKFFKDRHWLAREWSQLTELSPASGGVVEVGCGVGNAALPLLDVVPAPVPVYACDFAPTAIEILKKNRKALDSKGRLRAFVADASEPGALVSPSNPDSPIQPHSLSAATLIFALSAMSPLAMVRAVENVKGILVKSSDFPGRVFVRDYAFGDMASKRLSERKTPRRLHSWLGRAGRGESEGGGEAESAAALLNGGDFFARGDGTRAFYFTEQGLRRLFESRGFATESIGTVHMVKENRASGERMPRKWVQAVFRLGGGGGEEKERGSSLPSAARATATTTTTVTTEEEGAEERGDINGKAPSPSRYRPEWQDSDDDGGEEREREEASGDEKREKGDGDNGDSSPSSSSSDEETTRAAARLFRTVLVDSTDASSGSGPSSAVVGLESHSADVGPPLGAVAFSAAPSELRSTLGHTGLLTWPAAPALARILLSLKGGAQGRSLLEVGAGASPLVALAAARGGSFRRVVSTDGSLRALRLLSSNISSNAHLVVCERIRVAALPWGDEQAAREVVELSNRNEKFDVVVGADTLYSPPALPRLMATVAATLSDDSGSSTPPLAVLCYQERRIRVSEAEAAAELAGLSVVDPAPEPWLSAADRAGVGEGKLLRLLCLRHGS